MYSRTAHAMSATINFTAPCSTIAFTHRWLILLSYIDQAAPGRFARLARWVFYRIFAWLSDNE